MEENKNYAAEPVLNESAEKPAAEAIAETPPAAEAPVKKKKSRAALWIVLGVVAAAAAVIALSWNRIIPKFRYQTIKNLLAPTCTEEGINLQENGWGRQRTVTVPALGHSMVKREFTPPDCNSSGEAAHFYCARCGQCFADYSGKEPHDEAYFYLPAQAHKLTAYAEAPMTCTQDGHKAFWFCANCGAYFTDAKAGSGSRVSAEDLIIPAQHVFENGKCVYCGLVQTAVYVINDNGTATLVSCSKEIEGTFVIPEYTDNGLPVTGIGPDAFAGCDKLTELLIPGNVKAFGEGAFANCPSLRDIFVTDPEASNWEYNMEWKNLGLAGKSVEFPENGNAVHYYFIGNDGYSLCYKWDGNSDETLTFCWAVGNLPAELTVPAEVAGMRATAVESPRYHWYDFDSLRFEEGFQYFRALENIGLFDEASVYFPKSAKAIETENPYDGWNAHYAGTVAQFAAVKSDLLAVNCSDGIFSPGGVGLSFEYESHGDGTCKVTSIPCFLKKEIVIPDRSPAGDIVTELGDDLMPIVGSDGEKTPMHSRVITEYISLPATVTKIGKQAFSVSIGVIRFAGTVAEWLAIEKDEEWIKTFWYSRPASVPVECSDG